MIQEVVDDRIITEDPALSLILSEQKIAKNRLDYAETQNEIDSAIYEMQAADLKMRALLIRNRGH